MEVPPPEVVPDPSESVVPAVSDSPAVSVEGEDVAVVEDVVADVVEKDEVADVAPVSTPAGSLSWFLMMWRCWPRGARDLRS